MSEPAASATDHPTRLVVTAVAALGIVYGDIGTSPLYTIKELFNPAHGITATPDNVLGALSLIFWAITIVVSLKYVVFIMRADNRGEGGIMALMSLTLRAARHSERRRWLLMSLGLFGAALFYGDGAITPAISVLSAVEGLELATPAFRPYVVPITISALVALFLIQKRGTGKVGALFGPIMGLWFLTLALLGLISIAQNPGVLAALNPARGLAFFLEHRWFGFLALGAVVLAVTGGEALYADMGHFGKYPIRVTWFSVVMPALLLNYFGQGALLIREPEAVRNPFYLLAPDWGLYPMVALSTAATIIASQAVITGAFSVTRQAIQLGYLPRMDIHHTSAREMGQIYIPAVNWALLGVVVLLVLGFKSSSNLAAAYGIAVTGTMAIDTLLAVVVAYNLWGWGLGRCVLMAAFFLVFDLAFFSANATKIPEGGWFPLVQGLIAFTVMSSWKRGRQLLYERLSEEAVTLEPLLDSLIKNPPQRIPGTAVFLVANPDGVPQALLHNLKHNKVLHDQVVLLTVITKDIPWVPEDERVSVATLGGEFYRVRVRYGFMDTPHIPRALEQCVPLGLPFNMMDTSFFLSRESLVPRRARGGMAMWRKKLMIGVYRNAGSVTNFFNIPTNRVIELGAQVEF